MNAVKHAHPTGLPISFEIACTRSKDGGLVLEVGDDGIGLPEGFDTATDGGLGFRLIRALADKLNARLAIESDALGLQFRLRVPPGRI
jgi:two-component sensor histidine kinase